jgi:spore coat protein H
VVPWGPALLGLAALQCVGEDVTSLEMGSGPSRVIEPSQPDPEVPSGPGGGVVDPGEDEPGEDASGEKPPLSYPACQPRAVGARHWTTEGDTIAIDLECASGAELPGEAFEIGSLPAHASFDAAARRITFSPGLDQAGVYDIELGVLGSIERGHVEVQVADGFGVPGNAPPNPYIYTLEHGLPVVHLELDSAVNSSDYTPAIITYRGKTYEGADAKYRGATSLRYPKKSFTLRFAKSDRFADALSVAGFTGKRKVTLTTTFDDNSYLRSRLAFEYWNRVGVEHIQVQAYNVVVYLDGVYHGLYTLTDKVDGNLMEDNGLFEDGNLYKARTHDANFRLSRASDPTLMKADLALGFTKEEGTPAAGEPEANADLEALVGWVATSSSEEFVAGLDERVVQRDYEDWWMLVTLLNTGDTTGKNTYHYRDAREGAPDGRFRMVPWDFNDSFGQNWTTLRKLPTRPVEEFNERNEIFVRLCGEPELRTPLLARFRSVLAHEWELSSVLSSFDTWADEVHEAALRDESFWSGEYAAHFSGRDDDLTTHDQEVEYVRDWIIARYEHVQAHFWATTSEDERPASALPPPGIPAL